MSDQRPLELILARNLLSSLSTPAFLLGQQGTMLFYNEAAATLVGRRFEEAQGATNWIAEFGPFDRDGQPLPLDQIPATAAVREKRPYHGRFRIAAPGGGRREIEASTIPIVGSGGATGAIVIFWPVHGNGESEPSPPTHETNPPTHETDVAPPAHETNPAPPAHQPNPAPPPPQETGS
jgi:PAS domain-containing protein